MILSIIFHSNSLVASSSRPVVEGSTPGRAPRFVALAMKRKHDATADLDELRKRAGELVARAGLENGNVKA